MMGLPGLGKSTYSKDILMTNNNSTILVSSDSLRATLLNDIERQDENKLIFSLMKDISINALNAKKDVIYDATNIKEDKRRSLITEVKNSVGDLEVIGLYCVGSLDVAYRRNMGRDRKVPENVIKRMAKDFQIPTARDSYLDRIEYFSIDNIEVTSLGTLLDVTDYESFIHCLETNVESFSPNIDLAQDCAYHSLSVSRHIYEAFNYGLKHIPANISKYKKEILYALAFHDIGKATCKEIRNGSRYAHFKGHENVSAQIFMGEAYKHLCFWDNKTSIDIPFTGALIKEHGFPYAEKDPVEHGKALYKIEEIYGKEFRDCLIFIRECDNSGK